MNHRTNARFRIGAVVATAAVCGSIAVAGSAQAAVATDTTELREAVTVEGVMEHLQAFQDIADLPGNDGNRAAGTPGHDASVDYVEGLLDAAGYDTWRQEFTYERTDFGDSTLQQIAPNAVGYVLGIDYFPMSFSGEANVTANVTPVDLALGDPATSTSGCEAADFAGFPAGNIALLQRGACAFGVKADNAFAAGAAGAIIFNQGNIDPTDDRFGLYGGTLGEPVRSIPVVSAPFALGEEWANTPGLRMTFNLEAEIVEVTTENLIADTRTGRTDRTVVVGAHLDSVAEGPGINDNGSGAAATLETALQMAEVGIEPENRVRFAFWSGEEDGLIGSSHYVSELSARDIKNHALNLNFDMVGSANAAYFVYDGDGDAFGTKGPNGSAVIEDVFTDFFDSEGSFSEPTAFDGRSDYFDFIEAGIPAGGLFSGAEGIMTADEAERYDGIAGEAYDPCYHLACDDIDNVDEAALDIMSDAIAHSTLTFAETTSAVNGTAKGKATGQIEWLYQGNKALR